MAKVVSTLFISADGVAEIDPAWHFPYFDENMGRAVGEDYNTADVLLIGRETYDSFAGAWPDREAAGGDDAPFAKQIGDMRKVVVSRQPLEFSWRNSELVQGDLVEAVGALKADPGVTQALRRRRGALPPDGDGDGGFPDGRDPRDLRADRGSRPGRLRRRHGPGARREVALRTARGSGRGSRTAGRRPRGRRP